MASPTDRRVVVFAGDSVTEWGRGEDPDGLGSGYVGMLARHPRLAGARVVNSGIGGDCSGDLAARWDLDVLAHSPTVVSVLIGVNDTLRRYDGTDRTTPAAEFEATCRALFDRLPGTGRLVVVEPFLLPVLPGQDRWAEDLAPKVAALRRLAQRRRAVWVPTQEPLAQCAAEVGAAALAADGIHPTHRGHRVLADAWLAATEEH